MKRLAMILTLIASLSLPIQAHAASPYDGPPSDLKALELKLLNSIATINCGTKTGIGFAGSYTMSQANNFPTHVLILSAVWSNVCVFI